MPSHLRMQSSFEPTVAHATYQTSPTLPLAKKPKMSLTQTYYVASTARSKLGREASRPDHNLRLLVGHANLLDTLMVKLADAEREQEAWFNHSVTKASKPEEPRHIQWADTIVELEEEQEEDEESDSDSESDSDIYDDTMFDLIPRQMRTSPIEIVSTELSEHADEDYDEDDDEEHALTRTVSHSPPELFLDSDSEESEDESMPSSPESSAFELDEKQREIITTTSFYDMKDVIMQQQQQPQQPIIAAC